MRKALYILAGLEDRDIIWLLQAGDLITLSPGDTLIEAGHEVRQLFCVIEGRLSVVLPDGTEVAKPGEADIVGEMSFVEKRLPSTSVVADVSSTLLAVPREAVLEQFARDTAFSARFYKALAIFLSDRLRSARGGENQGELDEAVLETLHVAGDRYLRLIAMVKGRTF